MYCIIKASQLVQYLECAIPIHVMRALCGCLLSQSENVVQCH